MELVGREQDLAAAVGGAALLLGLLRLLRLTLLLLELLARALAHAHVLLPHGVDVLLGRPADELPAHGALHDAAVVAAGLGALVRVVAAVLQAEDAAAAVAREGQEVLLVASGHAAVRADVHGWL